MRFFTLQIILALLPSRVLADHDANWFRTTEAGRHGALEVGSPTQATTCLPKDAFVRVNGNKFELGGKEFIFAGWNQWEMMEAATGAGPPARHLPLPGREHIQRLLNEGVAEGLKVVRVWAHTISKGNEVQSRPGVWDEDALRGLDFFLDEARKRDVKVCLVLADNWYPVGGVDQYVAWSQTADKHQDFFTDANSKRIFKDMIRTITTRRNTINGVVYGDDATIMSYNLVNEARCQNCPASTIGKWIDEMATYLKSFAPNQLVGLGYEGFFHSDDPEERRATNPGEGSDWASREGQSWARHSRMDSIDYVSIHVWPDNWFPTQSVELQQKFIKSRINIAERIGKPFVLEEFGKQVDRNEGATGFAERDKYFAAAFDLAESAARDGKLSGTIFWHWYDRGVGLTSSYGIHSDETTFDLVRRHAKRMNAITGTKNFCSSA